MRVLIAEDEQRLAEAIARGLRREGMAVDLAPDGTDHPEVRRARPRVRELGNRPHSDKHA